MRNRAAPMGISSKSYFSFVCTAFSSGRGAQSPYLSIPQPGTFRPLAEKTSGTFVATKGFSFSFTFSFFTSFMGSSVHSAKFQSDAG